MRIAPTIVVLCAAAGLALPLAAQARPYLILAADDSGFKALDLGDVKRTPEGPNPSDRTIVDRRPPPAPVTARAGSPPSGPMADPYATHREEVVVEDDGPSPAPPPARPAAPTPAQLADARNDSRFLEEQIRAGRIIDDRDVLDRSAAGVDHDDLNAQMMRFRPQTVAVNLIDAPAAGALIGDRLAPMIRRRVEVSCDRPQWRTLSVAYLDAREKQLGEATTTGDWSDIGDDPVGRTVRTAACQRRYNAKAVSRYLNIGEILVNFQVAHARPAPQPPTREQLLAERYKNSH
jgi:hypothetical protein